MHIGALPEKNRRAPEVKGRRVLEVTLEAPRSELPQPKGKPSLFREVGAPKGKVHFHQGTRRRVR
jgi:hypothetical protein